MLSLDVLRLHLNFESSRLVQPLLHELIVLIDLALSVLGSFEPLSLVEGPFFPVHLPEPVAQVVNECALVIAPTRPCVLALTVSFVVDIIAFILLSAQLPHSLPEPQPILELSLVDRSIVPEVGPHSLWLPIGVLALIPVSVVEYFCSLAVLVTVLNLPAVLRQTRLDVALSLGAVVLPGPRVELGPRLPLARPVLHAVDETAVVDVLVGPHEYSIRILGLVVDEPPHVHVAVDELQPVAVLAVVLEGALVEADVGVAVDQQPVAVVVVVAGLPEVQRLGGLMKGQFPL